MLYLIAETEYQKFPWCQRTLEGLNDESQKKRIPILPVESISAIPEGDGEAAILLLGASHTWISWQVDAACRRGIHPIVLASRFFHIEGGTFSSVSINMGETLQNTINYLHSLGRDNIALYGANPNAASDPFYVDGFCRITGRNQDVYYLDRSLMDTFRSLQPRLSEYNAIICVNDYAAIVLLHELHRLGIPQEQMPYIIGYGDLHLTRILSPSITTVSDNYEAFGRAAFYIYNLVIREKMIASINISISSQLIIRDTTGNQPFLPNHSALVGAPDQPDNRFFQDSSVSKIVNLEVLLKQCDEIDLIILDCLYHNATYPEIAETCFISETTVKYRIKKMKAILGVHSKQEMLECISLIYSEPPSALSGNPAFDVPLD